MASSFLCLTDHGGGGSRGARWGFWAAVVGGYVGWSVALGLRPIGHLSLLLDGIIGGRVMFCAFQEGEPMPWTVAENEYRVREILERDGYIRAGCRTRAGVGVTILPVKLTITPGPYPNEPVRGCNE